MNFNQVLLDVKDINNSSLWQWAENYLYLGQKCYRVISTDDKKVKIEEVKCEKNIITTILKIISYIVIILPIFAILIKAIYRKKYSFEILKTASIITPSLTGSLKKDIGSFKENFEKLIEKEEGAENILEKIYTQSLSLNNVDFAQAKKDIHGYLSNLSTYTSSQEKVVQIVYTALRNLLDKPVSKERIDFANAVYKEVSAFLRNVTAVKYKENYREYLEQGGLFDAGTVEFKPAAYVKVDKVIHALGHSALIYLLKHLRKQIKIIDKQNTIRAKIGSNQQINLLPKNIVEKALSYLRLTWMHGTKAYVIKSACEQSNGELLPTGELQKRKITIKTGEMQNGATAVGINQRTISGVNLPHASKSINYAENYSFNFDEELDEYSGLFKCEFKRLDDFLNYQGSFSRRIEALRRVQIYQPETFQKDKPSLIKKLAEIHSALQIHVFDKKPKELFRWHDCYYTSMFYSFLKAIDDLEELIRSPLKNESNNEDLSKIPIVVASDKTVGIPTTLSTWEEPSEKSHLGALKLGKDIQVVFANDKDIPKVQTLIQQQGLDTSITVESMSILKTAEMIDRELGSYFYDPYNMRKWQKMAQG